MRLLAILGRFLSGFEHMDLGFFSFDTGFSYLLFWFTRPATAAGRAS